jgi:transcriptional regulator with XRE-family HTH domain
MLTRHEIGRRLKIAREKAGYTTRTAAEALGICHNGYAQYETGSRIPSLPIIYRWIWVLRLDPHILMPEFVPADWASPRRADPPRGPAIKRKPPREPGRVAGQESRGDDLTE